MSLSLKTLKLKAILKTLIISIYPRLFSSQDLEKIPFKIPRWEIVEFLLNWVRDSYINLTNSIKYLAVIKDPPMILSDYDGILIKILQNSCKILEPT